MGDPRVGEIVRHVCTPSTPLEAACPGPREDLDVGVRELEHLVIAARVVRVDPTCRVVDGRKPFVIAFERSGRIFDFRFVARR
jgi:hypothetical protein